MYGRSRLTYARERVRLTNHLRIRCCAWEKRVMFLPTIPGNGLACGDDRLGAGISSHSSSSSLHPACDGDKGYLDDPKRSWRRVVEMRRRIGAAGRRT